MVRMRLLICLVALAAAVVTAAVCVPHSPAALQALVASAGPMAAAGFVAIGAGLTLAMFPGTILAAAAGLAFGPVLGCGLALAAQTFGGVLAAALARSSARGAAERVAGRRLRRLSDLSETTGALGVAALRAAPGMPATALHYVLGLSRIRLRAVAAGLAMGAAPRIVAYALIGGGVAHLTTGPGLAGLILLGVTTVMSGVWALRGRRASRKSVSGPVG